MKSTTNVGHLKDEAKHGIFRKINNILGTTHVRVESQMDNTNLQKKITEISKNNHSVFMNLNVQFINQQTFMVERKIEFFVGDILNDKVRVFGEVKNKAPSGSIIDLEIYQLRSLKLAFYILLLSGTVCLTAGMVNPKNNQSELLTVGAILATAAPTILLWLGFTLQKSILKLFLTKLNLKDAQIFSRLFEWNL